MAHVDDKKPPSLTAPMVWIAAAAAAALLPFLWLGIPSGHDFEFHLNSWVEVLDHWRQGVLYPHWAGLAHYGYGEARFIFYPPLSWTLGAALGSFLPWPWVPAAYLWIALVLSGTSMFVLARRWLPTADAVTAAVLYAVNPYHLVIVYWRSALAELLAAAYLPLLLRFILRSEEEGPRAILPLSLVMAAGWLTNVPSAVMMNYSLAVLMVCIALRQRSFRPLAHGAAAAAMGLALAAIYLVPVIHQRTWINIAQAFAPGVRPIDNFLFTVTADADHNRFNLLVSLVATAEIAVVAALLFFARRSRSRKIWPLALAWSALATALMFRPALLLWDHLPELRFVQLPWRWLLCLNVALALLVPLALRRWWRRGAVYAAAVGVALVGWQRVQAPWWDTAADIREMVDNQHDGIGNEGADEYVPAGADPYEIDQQAPEARLEGHAGGKVEIKKWQAEDRLLAAHTDSAAGLVLRLFNYPAWVIEVNGVAVQTATTSDTGQIVVPLPAGESLVRIRFAAGWDRRTGAGISLVSFIGLIVWHAKQCKLTAES